MPSLRRQPSLAALRHPIAWRRQSLSLLSPQLPIRVDSSTLPRSLVHIVQFIAIDTISMLFNTSHLHCIRIYLCAIRVHAPPGTALLTFMQAQTIQATSLVPHSVPGLYSGLSFSLSLFLGIFLSRVVLLMPLLFAYQHGTKIKHFISSRSRPSNHSVNAAHMFSHPHTHV